MISMNRRQALSTLSAATAISACHLSDPMPVYTGPDMDPSFSAARLNADLMTYHAFGIHRSGSTADRATCDWLAQRLEDLDYHIEQRPISVDNYDALVSTIVSSHARIELAAQPPFHDEPNCRVAGELVYCGHAGLNRHARNKIIVADAAYARASSYEAAGYKKLAALAISEGARALILITNGPSSEATWLNLRPDTNYPLTALCAPKHADPLRAAALRGEFVTLTTPPKQPKRTAVSIIASRPGDRGRIAISTPVSGWTSCAGERGPGIATMLALAAWVPRSKPNHSIKLFVTNGHELGDLGMRDILDNVPPSTGELDLWAHLGAGFAARNWFDLPDRLAPMQSADPQRFLLSSESQLAAAKHAFEGISGLENVHRLTPEVAAGELQLIAKAGYSNVVGMFGAHRYHHTIFDGVQTVSGGLISPVVRAIGNLILTI